MKKQIIIIALLVGSLFASAQKGSWTIGFNTGVQGNIITSVKQEYFGTDYFGSINEWNPPMVGITHAFSHIPLAELTIKYNIRNHFSIATGVGYRNYYLKAKYRDFYSFTYRDDFIQVPIIFQYDIPLKKKGFSLFVQGGIGFDFEIYDKGWEYYPTEPQKWYSEQLLYVENSTESYFNNADFNMLLHAGFGFSYKFNSGVGISLLGRYNIGALFTSIHSYHTTVKEFGTDIIVHEMKEQLYGKAESWNVLLGITYTFKKK